MMVTRRIRFLVVLFLLSLASFYAGTYLVDTPPAPPTHPITGRQIAGIATDVNWLDRATREQEEQPERALDLIGPEVEADGFAFVRATKPSLARRAILLSIHAIP